MIASLMFAVSFKVYRENKDNLLDLDHYEGILNNFYITQKSSVVGAKVSLSKKFLALEILGLNQKIRVFRPNQNYSDFLRYIKKGDKVSIYYRKNKPDYFNSSIYQLDINNQNYLNIENVKTNHKKAMFIAFFGGLLFLMGAFYTWRKEIYIPLKKEIIKKEK